MLQPIITKILDKYIFYVLFNYGYACDSLTVIDGNDYSIIAVILLNC